MIFLFFTSPLAPLEAEICPIEVWYGMAVVVPWRLLVWVGASEREGHQDLHFCTEELGHFLKK